MLGLGSFHHRRTCFSACQASASTQVHTAWHISSCCLSTFRRGPPGRVEGIRHEGGNESSLTWISSFGKSILTSVSSQVISTNLSTQIPGFIADTGDAAPLGANEVQNIYQSTFEIYVSAQCKKQMDVPAHNELWCCRTAFHTVSCGLTGHLF